VQSWFVSVQRELWRGALVDLAYLGNRADDLLLFANYNQATPNNSAGTIPLQQRRPIPEFGDITISFNGGKSRYQAFQGKFEWRLGGSFLLLNSLTLSQTKDIGAGSLENNAGSFVTGNNPSPQNFYDIEADFGLGTYHQPYNNTTSVVYDLPFGTGRRWGGNASPWLDALVGGWQVALINSFFAGQTVSFYYEPASAFQVSSISQDFRGQIRYRPNIVGEVLVPSDQRSPQNYFNRAGLVIPDQTQPFGTAPRNAYRGRSIVQADFAASKRFQMPWRNGGLEFRAEFFNLFNRANYYPPNVNLSLPTFGTITQAFDPRIVQLGLKATF
jgi:hypothetical protein